jgi:hypothetical protein
MALIEDVGWISEVHMAQILKFLHHCGCMIYIFFFWKLRPGVMIDFSVNFYVQISS